MHTKLNAIQQIDARLQISKELARELQSKMEKEKNDKGEVLLNFEEMMSLLEDFYIVSDLNDDMPIVDNWHGKFN
jgi:hypothetical protein